MQLLRSVLAVVVGYLIFAASAYAVFRVSGQAPHAQASTGFMFLTVAAGVVFAIAGGYAAGVIAGRRPVAHAAAVALLLSAGATASLVATVGRGSIWSQVAALVFMAPSAVVGGHLRARAKL